MATEDEDVATTTQDVESNNGTSLNGTSLNGTSLNGTSLNGTSLNGTSLNGTSLNGTSLNGTSLNGTSLNGTSLNGSTWTGTLSNGSTINLRIDTSTKGNGENDDVGMYAVSYQTSSGWSPLCGTSGGSPILALAVPGVWTTPNLAYQASGTQYTWACRGKTIAKCVEFGYKPWTNRTTQLASCVRMLRGDYCGDGLSSTVDGQLIDFYDNVGIQFDTQEHWDIEAEWTPSGARCISKEAEVRYQYLSLVKPSCIKLKVVKATFNCGESFANGAILIDRLPHNPNIP